MLTPADAEAAKALAASAPLPTAEQRARLIQFLRPPKRLSKAA